MKRSFLPLHSDFKQTGHLQSGGKTLSLRRKVRARSMSFSFFLKIYRLQGWKQPQVSVCCIPGWVPEARLPSASCARKYYCPHLHNIKLSLVEGPTRVMQSEANLALPCCSWTSRRNKALQDKGHVWYVLQKVGNAEVLGFTTLTMYLTELSEHALGWSFHRRGSTEHHLGNTLMAGSRRERACSSP